MKRLLLAVLLSISPVIANAQLNNVVQRVITHQSIQNESYEDFLLRVGKFMNGWTKQHNSELCGRITTKNKGYYVILSTNYDPFDCVSRAVVTDTAFTGDTIHSHTYLQVNSMLMDRNRALAIDKAVGGSNYLDSLFTPDDYNRGSGYLVVDDALYYQKGKGTVRMVGKLPSN